ncbi:unnamed protein product [Caretta caretta]
MVTKSKFIFSKLVPPILGEWRRSGPWTGSTFSLLARQFISGSLYLITANIRTATECSLYLHRQCEDESIRPGQVESGFVKGEKCFTSLTSALQAQKLWRRLRESSEPSTSIHTKLPDFLRYVSVGQSKELLHSYGPQIESNIYSILIHLLKY